MAEIIKKVKASQIPEATNIEGFNAFGIRKNDDGTIDNVRVSMLLLKGNKMTFSDLTEVEKDELTLKWEHLTPEQKEGLKLKWEHLTDEQKEELKLKWEHLTDEDKDELKQPAIEGGDYALAQGNYAQQQGNFAQAQGVTAQQQGIATKLIGEGLNDRITELESHKNPITVLTEDEYEALEFKDPDIYYFIIED